MDETQDGRPAEALEVPGGAGVDDDLANQLQLQEAVLLALAHDLRASVAALAGASETLRRRTSDGDGNDVLLDIVDEALSTIQVVISNLFDVERLRHGAMKVVRRPTELGALMRQSVDNASLGNRVILEVGPEPIMAHIDVGLTERVLWNLLRNAAVHSPPGTQITLSVSVEGDHVLLRVEDAGPGIPPRERKSVFAPFQRGSSGNPGTGVGLFLVRQFTRAQGGETWIEGRPDGGTAVHVRLPH